MELPVGKVTVKQSSCRKGPLYIEQVRMRLFGVLGSMEGW